MRTNGFPWHRALAGGVVWFFLWPLSMFVYHWIRTGAPRIACSETGLCTWKALLVYLAGAVVVGVGTEMVRARWKRTSGRNSQQ